MGEGMCPSKSVLNQFAQRKYLLIVHESLYY